MKIQRERILERILSVLPSLKILSVILVVEIVAIVAFGVYIVADYQGYFEPEVSAQGGELCLKHITIPDSFLSRLEKAINLREDIDYLDLHNHRIGRLVRSDNEDATNLFCLYYRGYKYAFTADEIVELFNRTGLRLEELYDRPEFEPDIKPGINRPKYQPDKPEKSSSVRVVGGGTITASQETVTRPIVTIPTLNATD